jgi:glutathione synthase/RimK-type ligase-like ATP-grasp enzyme
MAYTYDITLLTDRRYVNPDKVDSYIQNVLLEDQLAQEALEAHGLRVNRINWDNTDFDWTSTRFALFRATWDYFERIKEFWLWFETTKHLTKFINHHDLIQWNIDKHYLTDLEDAGIGIPKTIFIEPGNTQTLADIFNNSGWSKAVLKPAVSGGAWNTYLVRPDNIQTLDPIFQKLIANESMLLQEFQEKVLTKGEVTFVLFGGAYSHSILKRAKSGDFRVQDDFGGTVHSYEASNKEIDFAKKVIEACPKLPVYSRVDAIWDNSDSLVVSEVELIEPELWFRMEENSPYSFAKSVINTIDMNNYFS